MEKGSNDSEIKVGSADIGMNAIPHKWSLDYSTLGQSVLGNLEYFSTVR